MKGISLFHLADVSGLIGKEILLDRVRQGLKTLCFVDKRGVVLETLLDMPVLDGERGKGVAK